MSQLAACIERIGHLRVPAALRAENRQARGQAGALVEASTAILLDSVIAITEEVLTRRQITLAKPVAGGS
jgi:hypothetical protein